MFDGKQNTLVISTSAQFVLSRYMRWEILGKMRTGLSPSTFHLLVIHPERIPLNSPFLFVIQPKRISLNLQKCIFNVDTEEILGFPRRRL